MLRFTAALVLAIGAMAPARANETTAELATGGLRFVQNDNVEMRSEDLSISTKQIDVRYRFWNFYSYVVCYLWRKKPIQSIAVFHGARDLAAFLSSRSGLE